nr:TNF receptor-associated factor 5-like [Rhipicephalus microplus]
MPDHAGRQALHRLCDSVSGANWRPTRFEDEFTLSRYACCTCHVIPSTTVLLPCSHALCEQCLTGCVIQDGGSVCPLDAEPFCEDECLRWQLPARKKQNLKAHCWNEADGCQFVGTIEAVLLHYDRECTFHAVQCRNCEQRLLRTDIAAHYASGCCQNASCARNAQSNREISSPASFETNVVLDKFSTLERKINEVLEVCSASNSARSQDISHAVGAFENTLQRIMEGIEENISTMITRQLTAGLQELKAATTVLCSDHLASSQSQMNEFVEQLRQRDGSQIQEIGSVLRDSQVEVKEEVKIQLEKTVSLLIASKCDVKQNVRTQLEEFVQEMRNCVGVLKEHGMIGAFAVEVQQYVFDGAYEFAAISLIPAVSL